MKTQILSVGHYLPEDSVKSDDLFTDFNSELRYGIPHQWMSNIMGIEERRMAPANALPSDLAVPAAREAIENSSINPDEIDLVIFCGIERDHPEPATAHVIQSKLGLAAPFAFDVANACYGFVDALSIAMKFVKAGAVTHALICTGEVPSKVLRTVHEKLKIGVDQQTAKKLIGGLSVGDAGGAVVIGPSHDGVGGFDLLHSRSDSRHARKCYYRFDEQGQFHGQMLMGHLAALMITKHQNFLEDTLKTLGWNNFDWLLSHQIGKKPFDRLVEFSGLNDSQMVKTYPYLGNIATATFPIGFHTLSKSAKLTKGDRIGGCFGGSGVVYGQFGYTFT